MNITEYVAELALQIGVIVFAVRLCGKLIKKIGLPAVVGELISGIIIGPYALGSISLPGFPHGIFPIEVASTLAVSTELYAIATLASIVLLFSAGLETNLGLFLRYFAAGGLIGFCGALLSFSAGVVSSAMMLGTSFTDPHCLFLGVVAATTSVGISARILSERRKIDSPEGVTIMAAAVFDDVIWIILLAVVMGIVDLLLVGNAGDSLSVQPILIIAVRAFIIWLVVTVIGLLSSKLIARFLKIFKNSYDFSILAMGIAMILAGLFEKQGLAMIIGSYIAGLALSRTDIAPLIQERIRGIYEFLVPVFFTVMGMMVNVREVFSAQVLILGGVFTLAAILAKTIGCGGPALLLGFNIKGALRIGTGMIPRGEGALITAGIGLASGILGNQVFSVSVLMILITIIIAPPLLSGLLKLSGRGTKKSEPDGDSVQEVWEFISAEISDLVMNILLKELRSEGFFIERMNIDEGLSQARKDDTVIVINSGHKSITIQTSKKDMSFVKNEVYEALIELSEIIQKLRASPDPVEMKKNLLDEEGRASRDLLSLIEPEFFTMELKGDSKESIITELVDLLAAGGKLLDSERVLEDVFERELAMGTGMEYGVALPHAKSDGVKELAIAVGIKKEGIVFGSIDGKPSRIFVLAISPKNAHSPYIQFLAAVGSVLLDETLREAIITAPSAEEAVKIIKKR